MADEAGPAPKPVDQAVLAEADAKFERGIQCIRTNDIEQAVQLFAEVLQVKARHFGELALECAPAYYRYGAALLYQAQDSADVFGTSVKGAAGEEEEEEEQSGADDKENGGDKGKAPVAEADGVEDEAGEEEEGEESGEAAENDLQLAWENLETAKVIWSREGEERHSQQLADVHGLLGDVAMESDDFDTALKELDSALAHLQKFVTDDDRRIAEVQYKRCCALQFGGAVEAALPAVQAAIDCLHKRQAVLAAKLEAPCEGTDAEKLRAESADVAALLEDLGEKVAELRELAAQDADTKSMIKGAFAQLAAAGGGSDTAAPAAADAPAGPSAAAGGAVQNLGVVGRGTKRINLQPVQPNVPAAGPGEAGAPPGEPAPKKKRSLEDLMGGTDAGETTIGFGAAPAGQAAAGPVAEKQEQGAAAAAEPPAVPAFLQAANVQAVYGGASGSDKQ